MVMVGIDVLLKVTATSSGSKLLGSWSRKFKIVGSCFIYTEHN